MFSHISKHKLPSFVCSILLLLFVIKHSQSTSRNRLIVSNWENSKKPMEKKIKGDPEKRFFFPSGSRLSMESTLEVPITNPKSFGLGTTFKMGFPVTILFDELPIKLFSKDFNPNFHTNWFSIKDFHNMHRRKRSFFDTNNNTVSGLCSPLALDKLAIFRKLETTANSYLGMAFNLGKNEDIGKACILRTICEIHEYPIEQVYGTMGELIKQLFSVGKLQDTCLEEKHGMILKAYVKAEIQGQNNKCQRYNKSCRWSFFVSN